MSEYFLDLEKLIPVDGFSECNLNIGWFILEVVFFLDGVASSVELIVTSHCATGAIAGIIIVMTGFVFIVITRGIFLTFVVWVLNMSLINLKFFIIMADIDLVDLIYSPGIDGLFGEDVRFEIHGFFEGCL